MRHRHVVRWRCGQARSWTAQRARREPGLGARRPAAPAVLSSGLVEVAATTTSQQQISCETGSKARTILKFCINIEQEMNEVK